MEMSTYQLCRKSRLIALAVTAVKPARAHLRTTHSTIIPRAHDLITKRRFKCTLLSTTIPSKGPCGRRRVRGGRCSDGSAESRLRHRGMAFGWRMVIDVNEVMRKHT